MYYIFEKSRENYTYVTSTNSIPYTYNLFLSAFFLPHYTPFLFFAPISFFFNQYHIPIIIILVVRINYLTIGLDQLQHFKLHNNDTRNGPLLIFKD